MNSAKTEFISISALRDTGHEMSKLLRYHTKTDICFITTVTYNRSKILLENADVLQDAITKFRKKLNFGINAYVIMPDHFHAIIDCKNNDLSIIIQKIKASFSKRYRNKYIYSGKIWQSRFWDHIIRNQNDYNNHIDYIHYNPVKHNLAKSPFEWEYSSIHNYIDIYRKDWGTKHDIIFNNEFGE